jgi:hypothetical protein
MRRVSPAEGHLPIAPGADRVEPARNTGGNVTNAAIDCDLHPTVPGVATLLPYMDDYWRHTLVERGIEVLGALGG